MVLVGIQPTLKQLPPRCSRSMRAVFHPALAKAGQRRKVTGALAPMTIASYFCCVAIICSSLLDSGLLFQGPIQECLDSAGNFIRMSLQREMTGVKEMNL